MIASHDILHTVILLDGTQQVLKEIAPYHFKIFDLQRKTQHEQTAHIKSIRKRMSHNVYRPDQWPLFEVGVTVFSENQFLIHFSIDELLVDATSVELLFKQWFQLYENPESELPDLEISFRDYVLALKRFEESVQYQKDLSYWMEKLASMPQGPSLPMAENPQKPDFQSGFYRKRYHDTLKDSCWTALKKKAKELNRKSVFEYRFEEEFKENIHLYEKTLIDYGTRN